VQEWPYFQLQMRLCACLDEYGIAHTVVSAEYISQTCPQCGAEDPKNRDMRRWQLRCASCGYRRHLDVAAALNVLARGSSAEVVRETEEADSADLARSKTLPKPTARKRRSKGRK
jgi:transposase